MFEEISHARRVRECKTEKSLESQLRVSKALRQLHGRVKLVISIQFFFSAFFSAVAVVVVVTATLELLL